MKKICILCAVLLCSLFFASCSVLFPSPSPTPEESASKAPEASSAAPTQSVTPTVSEMPSQSPSQTVTVSPSPTPSETPSPSPSVFGETPDQAGNADVLFDIYQSKAEVDLNQDGTPEKVQFTAGGSSSKLNINGKDYTVNKAGLAQTFAITDVDNSDKILEIAFTDPYADLADSEKAFTWIYWWTGSKIINMGGLMDVKFAGDWRTSFDPKKYFDSKGVVTCLTRTQHFSDTWYNGHYKPKGTDRKLKEENYATKPVNQQEKMKLKHYVVLLQHCNSKFFGSTYSVMWDYASGTSTLPRDYTNDDVAFIPQAGEKLKIVGVYGPNWFKMQAEDGKKGWLKCVDRKVQGYWQVMHYTAEDIFEGIVVAG